MPLHQRTGWLPSKLRRRSHLLFAQAWEIEASSEEPFLSSGEEMDTDDVDAPKGRGCPGWTRKKGPELASLPHPDQSNIARDIITMQAIHPSACNYDEEVKKWRLAYRVPFPTFQVGHPPRTAVRTRSLVLLSFCCGCGCVAPLQQTVGPWKAFLPTRY